MIKWRWHRFWIWEPLCTVRSSAWNSGRITWRCSCGKSFATRLWPKKEEKV